MHGELIIVVFWFSSLQIRDYFMHVCIYSDRFYRDYVTVYATATCTNTMTSHDHPWVLNNRKLDYLLKSSLKQTEKRSLKDLIVEIVEEWWVLSTNIRDVERCFPVMTSEPCFNIRYDVLLQDLTVRLEATRFVFKTVQSLGNMAGTSAALLPMCKSDFRATR